MPQNLIRGDDPGRGYRLPADGREWLARRHLAWELLALAKEMDLASFTSWYRADGQGRPAYHPAMMVTLAGYCFCKGIRSSRAIEMATFDDVGARVICANLHPDHSTIHRFVTRHEQPVKGLLVQSVVACAREGLVSVDVVAGDGTKGRSRASMAANGRAADYQRRAAATAGAGSGKRPDGRAPAGAAHSSHVARARRAAERAAAALAEAVAGPAPAAAGKPLKINTTDPSSKVMQAKNGGFGQLHNIQALAGKHQVIYAIGAHPSPADVAALHPLLGKGRATLDAAGIGDPIGTALFDAGYASDANFTADCQAELYVAVTREARQTGRLDDGKKPKTRKDSWQQMAARLDTPEGKALYRQRAAIIEPVFAQLFARLGTHLSYRDEKVDLELHLWAASHNLLKAIRARRRRARQQRTDQAAVPALAT